MADTKLNCTYKEGNKVRAGIYYFEGAQNDFTRPAIALLSRPADLQPDTDFSVNALNPSDIPVEQLVKACEDMPTQFNIHLLNEAYIEQTAQIIYAFNNRFHNCPNVVFSNVTASQAKQLIQQYPSFDLLVYNNDTETLRKLVAKLAARRIDDEPITTDDLTHLVMTMHGDVIAL